MKFLTTAILLTICTSVFAQDGELFAKAKEHHLANLDKRIVYLQSPSEPKRGTTRNSDTTSRVYQTHFEDYKLKPKDIISIRIASITPGEFDFVKKYEQQLGLIRKLNQYDQGTQGSSGQSRMGMGASGVNGEDEVGDGMNAFMLDRMPTGFILDPEGNLELPFLGKLVLKGLTISQTEAFIKEKLKGFFETPVVRIQLLSFHFTILGEVNKEGRFTIFNPNATIIDAIAIAENLNDFADRSGIKIVRMEGDKAHVFYVNMLSEDLLGQSGYFLQPNDLIIVPPLEVRATKKYTLPAATTTFGLITSSISLMVLIITLSTR